MTLCSSRLRFLVAFLWIAGAGTLLVGCDSNGGGMTGPENQPPSASISLDSRSGLTAALSGAGSVDEDGEITSYEWNFGDGSSGSGETVVHEYDSDGTYTAELIVSDDEGAADTTQMDVMVSRTPTTFEVTIENVGSAAPVTKSGAFTPADVVNPSDPNAPPLQPGEAFEFSFTAGPNEVPGTGMVMSFATMFIQSNDLYYAFAPGGVPLYDDNGTPDNERDDTPIGMDAPVDLTSEVGLYDAGTEVDQEPGSGSNQAPRQSSLDQGPDEDGTVVEVTDSDDDGRLENDGFEYPAVADGVELTVQSQEDAETGSIRFTVRIENVSDETNTTVNGEPLLISPGSFAAHFDQVPTPNGPQDVTYPGHAPGNPASGGIEAIAEDGRPAGAVSGDDGTPAGNHVETLGGLTGVTVPLSPGAYAAHTDDIQAFATGESASDGIEAVAEDGSPGTLAGELDASNSDIRDAGVFNTPDGTDSAGPLAPGNSYSFQLDAQPGERLSFATMYIQSNDLFYGLPPNGLPLFSNDAPRNGTVTEQVVLYDAGTEGDEEPGTGLNQAPRQSGGDTGPNGEGSIVRVTNTDDDRFLDDDGFTYKETNNVVRVTVTPQN